MDTITRGQELHVVGIGASAGGLEALTAFFDHLPQHNCMAVVIVQHLSPNYRSFMAELLSSHTKMRVAQAEDGMDLEPNCVYLNPPKSNIYVEHGKLTIKNYATVKGELHLPIDSFFHSLAEDCGERAIGIVLSGTGSDGSRGIASIKRYGGIVLVQDESAKFDGMPRSATATGLVDAVLSPPEMARRLLQGEIGNKLSQHGEARVAASSVDEDPDDPTMPESNLADILGLLKLHTGIDYEFYKTGGVVRRVERRMGLEHILTVSEYIDLLQTNPDEVRALHKDLLIGVTSFFRDARAFEILYQQVLPQMFEQKKKDKELRIWVAGCSTGEEAYSVAILLQEYMETIQQYYNVKIFATDLDPESITFAGQGIYPTEIRKNVSAERLRRFFKKVDAGYQVSADIRKMVIFAPHNITKDPPFINTDLITCRNMLIYLRPEMQHRVLSLFHFALNARGFLFLGPSETVGKLGHLFNPLDKKWNLFQHNDVKVTGMPYPTVAVDRLAKRSPGDTPQAPSWQPMATNSQKEHLYRVFVEEHMPAAVIVDDKNDVVSLHGDINKYLSLSTGKPSNNVHRMFDSAMSVAIVTAMSKLKSGSHEVTYENIKLGDRDPDAQVAVNLVVRPLSKKDPRYQNQALVLIRECVVKPTTRLVDGDIVMSVNQHVVELERELQLYQEKLQVTVEELETSSEELQATNEELVAANEELQSTNEELHSVNEELLTVNAEYQMNIQELTELNNDMDNFLVSTQIGTLFLDSEMNIRRFTPAITSEINLMDVDVGRPIAHIAHNLKYKHLIKDIDRVLRSGTPIEREVESTTGHWYSLRILPYQTVDNSVKGTVLTLVDITYIKSMNAELRKLSYAIEQSPSIVVITDPRGRIEYVNPKFVECTGYDPLEVRGRSLRYMNNWRRDTVTFKEVWEIVSNGHKWTGEMESRRKDGRVYWESLSIVPILNNKNEIIHYLKVAEDITDVKNAEELLRKSEMLSALGEMAAGIAHEIRNPLTALKGFTRLIKSENTSDMYLEIMQNELERIETIINELLILSKPQAVKFHSFNLLGTLKDVVMLLDTQALMNQVEIRVDFEEDAVFIDGVDNQLKQVFINLLKNAIEAMPKGGKISLTAKRRPDGTVLIRVVDQGEGIPKERLAKLGKPFYTTKDKGTGLGLMVSYRIIEQHGGKIVFSSVVREGTTVEVILPCSDGIQVVNRLHGVMPSIQ